MKKKCSKKRIRYAFILIIIVAFIILIKNINKPKTKEVNAGIKTYENNQNKEVIPKDDENTNKTMKLVIKVIQNRNQKR